MSDDIRALLGSADGGPASPDHERIRRRARQLTVMRRCGLLAIVMAAAVAAGAVAKAITQQRPEAPIVSDPTPDEAGGTEETVRCETPSLRPTYLPWLEEGEDVPAPIAHERAGGPGLLVWPADRDRYDPQGPSETNLLYFGVEPADGFELGSEDWPQADVRGRTAELVWVGDPGIGLLSLHWREHAGPCGHLGLSLLIRGEQADFLDLPRDGRSWDELDQDEIDERMGAFERAVEDEIVRIANSLVEPGERPADEPPSQSREDALRDGVFPALAALPFDTRVAPESRFGSRYRVVTEEGVWVVSRFPAQPGEDHLLGDSTGGIYGRDFFNLVEYGEVFLLDHEESRILRAFPLPGLPPQALAVTDDAIYCLRQGDGALADSMLCRIDRRSFDWSVRIFPSDLDSGFDPPSRELPENWVVDAATERDHPWEDIVATDDGKVAAVGNEGGYSGTSYPRSFTPIDPETLELGDPASLDARREFGTLTAVDGASRTVTLDAAEWLSGEEADRAYEEETGDSSGVPNDYYIRDEDVATVRYSVADDVWVVMTFLWDYENTGEEQWAKPVAWEQFTTIWSDESPEEITRFRRSYYWIDVIDGEVARIQEQYRP